MSTALVEVTESILQRFWYHTGQGCWFYPRKRYRHHDPAVAGTWITGFANHPEEPARWKVVLVAESEFQATRATGEPIFLTGPAAEQTAPVPPPVNDLLALFHVPEAPDGILHFIPPTADAWPGPACVTVSVREYP